VPFAAVAQEVSEQTVTSLRVGVAPASVVPRVAFHLRYRPLKNPPVRVAGLEVKKVLAVPSGPMKLNGPAGLLLAAAWNRSVVFAGVVPVHDRLFQCAGASGSGLESFTVEVRSVALLIKPGFTQATKSSSAAVLATVLQAQLPPLFNEVQRRPPG